MLRLTERHVKVIKVIYNKYAGKVPQAWAREQLEGAITLGVVKAINLYDPSMDHRAGMQGEGETYIYRCAILAAIRFTKLNWKYLKSRVAVIPATDHYMDVLPDTDGRKPCYYKQKEDEEYRGKLLDMVKEALTPEDWKLLHLYTVEGVVPRTLATVYGVSHQAIYNRLMRIRKRAREYVEGKGGDV